MASITYFVALPFEHNSEGELVAGEAREAQTESAARRLASFMAASKPGAIAFSRTGDPATGEFEDAVIIARYGEVAEDVIGRA
jgi:hypothetical protein